MKLKDEDVEALAIGRMLIRHIGLRESLCKIASKYNCKLGSDCSVCLKHIEEDCIEEQNDIRREYE